MATLTGKIILRPAHKYDLCACGSTKAKISTACRKCHFLLRWKNPQTPTGKYSHKKGMCIDCGKQISDVYRFHCRACSHLGKSRPNIAGKNNVNWKGGITKPNQLLRTSSQMKLWKNSVLLRDNFTCQKYNIKGGELEAHHIVNFSEYPELRFEVNNGITLSKKAHREFHKKYGFKRNTIEQLSDFLNNKNI